MDAVRAERVRRSLLGCALLVLALLAGGAVADAVDGRWQLRIAGHHSFVFGDVRLGGGVRIPWEVVIQFEVAGGAYQVGSGSTRWLDRIESLSHPPGWFSCSQVHGTYLDSNLALHETPRVRFAAFPVAGEMVGGRVRLHPGYEPPGNYLAVTYECHTDNPRVDNWFGLAERGKQVFGKRQDAETRREASMQRVRVREVASLPPEGMLDLPLQHGWEFAQGAPGAAYAAHYELSRLD